MLLDTCLLQHMKYVMDAGDGEHMSDEDEATLLRKYGPALGTEIVALSDLMVFFAQTNPPAWVVAEASLIEFERVSGAKGHELRQWWYEWAYFFDGCLDGGWYPDLDADRLLIRTAPAVADDQLSLAVELAPWPLAAECVPPFGPFADAGDRALIRAALRPGVPTILTTDLNSFWEHRRALYPLGIEVWRPTDLWQTLRRDAA